MNHAAEIRALKTRLKALEDWMKLAANRGTAALLPGVRVGYYPGRHICWTGRVIPFPEGARRCGLQGQLVYVMRDEDSAIRGCYPHNLVRL